MNIRQTAIPIAAAALLCLALCFPSWVAASKGDQATFTLTKQSLDNLRQEGLPNTILEKLEGLKNQTFDTEDAFLEAVKQKIGKDQTVRYKAQILKHAGDEIAAEIKQITDALQAQKRVIDELLAQNRTLEGRLAELEAARDDRAQQQAEAEITKHKELEKRVKELEYAEAGREEATRSIIRDAMSTVGSKINESVSMGGVLEVVGGWTEDFSGQNEGLLGLNTVDLDFEVEVNQWTYASFQIEYDDGTDLQFPTTSGFETGVDRFNLDYGFVTIGDPQRFPPFITAGKIYLPFGISTGNPVADVLSIQDPLTIEGFETREDAIGIGLGFPTPAITPPTPPVSPPPVRPLVINPLVSSISKAFGYKPSKLQPRPTPITPTPAPPIFNVGAYAYNGDTYDTRDKGGFKPKDTYNFTAGFRTQGNCGRPFDQLVGTAFCPWSIDVDVDYTSSVFDSRFLEDEYKLFLGQIGFVPGMAASVKATLGPVSLIGEWNGALRRANFLDGLGNSVNRAPSAWQVSLGYQFDWNPWVEEIGAQGNYITIGYSETNDLQGVTQVVNGEQSLTGELPKRRFIIGAGEWVLDNLQYSIEYNLNQDYPKSNGGTDGWAYGFFSQITTVW